VTVVDHALVQVDEFAAIDADERRKHSPILAGSIFVRSHFAQA